MRQYNPGTWGILFAFSLKGSTVLRGLAWAVPCTILTLIVNFIAHRHFTNPDYLGVGQAWAAYNWSIFFLVAFRTKVAYSRWWEGGSLLQKTRGEWFNAYSNLLSFCNTREDLTEDRRLFQVTLARLFSLLYCSALLTICQDEEGCDFEILDLKGMSLSSLEFLWRSADKTEIVNHWIQQTIVDNMRKEVLLIPAPVVSRVFQELSRGMVHFNHVLKISEFLFPFPFAQLTSILLITHWLLTPFVMGIIFESYIFGGIISFVSVFALWSINYTGTEVEQPFGVDDNDLPLHEMQAFMNASLVTLLEEKVQKPPVFEKLDANHELEAVLTSAYDCAPIVLRPRMAETDNYGFDFLLKAPRKSFAQRQSTRQSMRGNHVSVRSLTSTLQPAGVIAHSLDEHVGARCSTISVRSPPTSEAGSHSSFGQKRCDNELFSEDDRKLRVEVNSTHRLIERDGVVTLACGQSVSCSAPDRTHSKNFPSNIRLNQPKIELSPDKNSDKGDGSSPASGRANLGRRSDEHPSASLVDNKLSRI